MANQWFKMYGADYLSDPKIKSLTSGERSVWTTLLCYASVSSVEGEIMHLTEKQAMLDAGVDPLEPEWNKTVGVLTKFEQLGMIKIGNGGELVITNWNKRQNKNAMTAYERVRRHREREKGRGAIEGLQQEIFEKFWAIYPRKTQKQTAFKSWCKLNPDPNLYDQIIKALEQHIKTPQWQKDNGQFIPYPATWLNQRRWEDELTITRPKVGGGKFDNLPTKKV